MSSLKINPAAMGLSIGILAGLVVFFAGALANTFLAGIPISTSIGSLSLTYQTTMTSSLICGITTLVGAGIGTYICCLLYNFLADLV